MSPSNDTRLLIDADVVSWHPLQASGCKAQSNSVKDDPVPDSDETGWNSVTITTNCNQGEQARRPLAVPRLLVSVRSSAEVQEAIAGGVEILDVKEPGRGSLGMADVGTIREIAQSLTETRLDIPLSVALGELGDWTVADQGIELPEEVTFAKLGLRGMKTQANWRADWLRLRTRVDQTRRLPLRWVAVAYADAELAESPAIDDVVAAAIETNCVGVLIDTFAKTGQSLTKWVTASQLRQVSERCHASGLFLAIAGSLQLADLRDFREVNADIIAIRSAACANGDRKGAVNAFSITLFRESMERMSER